jgi:hypothetical protein
MIYCASLWGMKEIKMLATKIQETFHYLAMEMKSCVGLSRPEYKMYAVVVCGRCVETSIVT